MTPPPSATATESAQLRGRTVVVTGSSRGIGRAIAVLFAQQGAAVMVHGRDSAAVVDVCDEITAAGGSAVPVSADLTDPAEANRFRDQTQATLGAPDVLVANAGGSPPAGADRGHHGAGLAHRSTRTSPRPSSRSRHSGRQ